MVSTDTFASARAVIVSCESVTVRGREGREVEEIIVGLCQQKGSGAFFGADRLHGNSVLRSCVKPRELPHA